MHEVQLLVVPEQDRQGETHVSQEIDTLLIIVILGHDTTQVELYKYPEIQLEHVL